MDLHETDCGSRDFAVRDPEGNRWSFGTYRGEPARLSDVLATGWIRGSIRLGRMKPRIDLAHPGRAGAAAERRRPTERGRPAERGGRAERVIQAEPGRSAELIGPAERGRSRGADPAGPSGRRSPERGDFASAAPP